MRGAALLIVQLHQRLNQESSMPVPWVTPSAIRSMTLMASPRASGLVTMIVSHVGASHHSPFSAISFQESSSRSSRASCLR